MALLSFVALRRLVMVACLMFLATFVACAAPLIPLRVPSFPILFLVVNLLIFILLTSAGFFSKAAPDDDHNAIVLVPSPPRSSSSSCRSLVAMEEQRKQVEDLPQDVVLSIRDEEKALVLSTPIQEELPLACIPKKSRNECKVLVPVDTSNIGSPSSSKAEDKSPVCSPRRRRVKKKRLKVDIQSSDWIVKTVEAPAAPASMTVEMVDLEECSLDEFNRRINTFIEVKNYVRQQECKQEWRLSLGT